MGYHKNVCESKFMPNLLIYVNAWNCLVFFVSIADAWTECKTTVGWALDFTDGSQLSPIRAWSEHELQIRDKLFLIQPQQWAVGFTEGRCRTTYTIRWEWLECNARCPATGFDNEIEIDAFAHYDWEPVSDNNSSHINGFFCVPSLLNDRPIPIRSACLPGLLLVPYQSARKRVTAMFPFLRR
jgi:hypothetical protein